MVVRNEVIIRPESTALAGIPYFHIDGGVIVFVDNRRLGDDFGQIGGQVEAFEIGKLDAAREPVDSNIGVRGCRAVDQINRKTAGSIVAPAE